MEIRGKPVERIQSLEWVLDLGFAVDITDHLNKLNRTQLSLNTMTIYRPSSLNLHCGRGSCEATILLIFHVYKIFAMLQVLRT